MPAPVYYKSVRVGRGSALYDAIEHKDEAAAKRIHAEADAEFRRMYPMCDDAWFARMNAPIRNCSECGKTVEITIYPTCDECHAIYAEACDAEIFIEAMNDNAPV